MGKLEKGKRRSTKSIPNKFVEEDDEGKLNHLTILLSSDDDEADDDLSLKIVEKSLSRIRNKIDSKDIPSSSSLEAEVTITEVKKAKEKMEAQENAVEEVERKEVGGTLKETDALLDTDAVEKSDSIVLRKLLRGPRYFDPPDSSWRNCYNCGECGHTAANCTTAKRQKPCFVCGSLEHNGKQCKQGKDCFICKKSGHHAKNCPEKSIGGSQKAKICLKCGDSGHAMFSCKSTYPPDDLKEVQCYICNGFGHLCCVNYGNASTKDVSCYACGQLGHTGLECARVRAEMTISAGSCYECGEEGHIARKCPSSAKKGKRKSEFSSPKRSHQKDNGNHARVRSAPHDIAKGRKRNKTQYGHLNSSESRHWTGWITEYPGAYYHGNLNASGWGSPTTPASFNQCDRFRGNYGAGGYDSGFYSNRQKPFESSASKHRFSASRYGDPNSYGRR